MNIAVVGHREITKLQKGTKMECEFFLIWSFFCYKKL